MAIIRSTDARARAAEWVARAGLSDAAHSSPDHLSRGQAQRPALAGTLAVVRQAQLDIGFVRSQTEIGMLELQGDLPRGHLSRYTAIYSSLSSIYDLEFDNESSVATPFPRDDKWSPAIGDSIETVAFEKYDQPRLRGVAVSSATTQMISPQTCGPSVRLYRPRMIRGLDI